MGKHWKPLEHYSSWRKIAAGMWKTPSDPTVYGFETFDATNLVNYLDEVSRISGTEIGVAAFCARLTAVVFERHPDLNVTMVGKRVQQRTSADVFCQVALANADNNQADLSGIKLKGADQLDLVEVARRLASRADDVRAGRDAEMEQTKSMVDIVPPWLMGSVLKLVDFLTFNVPIDLDQFGIRSDPFGSAMVTSVGKFGIKLGFAPLVPASRVPMVVMPGVIHQAPVVTEDGEVEARPSIKVSSTFDHRVYDGYQIGKICKIIRGGLSKPTDYLPEPQHWASAEAAADTHSRPDSAPENLQDGPQDSAPPRRPEDREATATPAE